MVEGIGEEVRVVGGAVRNALMGVPVVDIDFATTATPDQIVTAAAAAGLKAVPTGIEHGTVTLVVDGRGFEVTTLREDIETDGRHAVVRFGRDWAADAAPPRFHRQRAFGRCCGSGPRSASAATADVVARRIRFIGDADQRIAEDRLRILRLFRFHAEYGEGAIDRDGLAAAIRARDGLRDLSPERVGQEMRRLVWRRARPRSSRLMQESGILTIVLGGVGYLAAFATLAALTAAAVAAGAPGGARLPDRRGRAAHRRAPPPDQRRARPHPRHRSPPRRRSLRRRERAPRARSSIGFGPDVFRDARRLRMGVERCAGETIRRGAISSTLPDRWTAPTFPLGGRDVIAEGVRGPDRRRAPPRGRGVVDRAGFRARRSRAPRPPSADAGVAAVTPSCVAPSRHSC